MARSRVADLIACLVVWALTVAVTSPQEVYYDMPNYRDHPCVRQCEDNSPPRLCKYHWIVENYHTLSKACFGCPFNQSDCFRPHCVTADGVSRGIRTINRMLPGPGVQVCEGDTIEVTVDNRMDSSEGMSIHWHGIQQKGSPHMDGVPLVTQCPISHRAKFTYKFKVIDPGTHYWHSHSSFQRSDGLYGPLIVRRPPSLEPHRHLYDIDSPEHIILITDWLKGLAMTRFSSYIHAGGDPIPAHMLINGMGQFESFTDDNGTHHYTPRAKFMVKSGLKYRFRIISNAMVNCPIQFSIDNHTLIMIASDGNSFEPYLVDSFEIFSGERFDFVLHTLDEPPGNYWIRTRGLGLCSLTTAHQTAILHYEGAAQDQLPAGGTSWDDGIREGKKLNPFNKDETDDLVPITRMRSTEDDDDTMTSDADRKIYLAMDFYPTGGFTYSNPHYYPVSSLQGMDIVFSPQINHISTIFPSSPPLTQYNDVSEEEYCNAETVQRHCETEWCECVHMYQFALGDLVELVMIDEGVTFDSNHPMHVHGYKFRVVGLGKLGTNTSLEAVKALDEKGMLNRTTSLAPLKDTVTVPDGGYTIIRFRANNPGVWLFHCHVQLHMETGMGMLFQVGTKDQFPPAPKNFPKCGDWKFHGYEDDDDDDDDDDESEGQGNVCGNGGFKSSPHVTAVGIVGLALVWSCVAVYPSS